MKIIQILFYFVQLIIDFRTVAEPIGIVADIYWISDEDLQTETWSGEALSHEIHGMIQNIKLTKTTLITLKPLLVILFIIQLQICTQGEHHILT